VNSASWYFSWAVFYFSFSVLVVILPVKISDRGKYKTLTLQKNVSFKPDHGASVQSVMNNYGVTRTHNTQQILPNAEGNETRCSKRTV
jgi:hypothetical protein